MQYFAKPPAGGHFFRDQIRFSCFFVGAHLVAISIMYFLILISHSGFRAGFKAFIEPYLLYDKLPSRHVLEGSNLFWLSLYRVTLC